MINDLGGITSIVAKAALDAAVARHDVIANNIANANTPGYLPKAFRFDDYMAAVRAELSGGDAHVPTPRDSQWLQTLTGQSVQLDMEMVGLSENVVRYQALLGALDKRGAILKMAIREGRL